MSRASVRKSSWQIDCSAGRDCLDRALEYLYNLFHHTRTEIPTYVKVSGRGRVPSKNRYWHITAEACLTRLSSKPPDEYYGFGSIQRGPRAKSTKGKSPGVQIRILLLLDEKDVEYMKEKTGMEQIHNWDEHFQVDEDSPMDDNSNGNVQKEPGFDDDPGSSNSSSNSDEILQPRPVCDVFDNSDSDTSSDDSLTSDSGNGSDSSHEDNDDKRTFTWLDHRFNICRRK